MILKPENGTSEGDATARRTALANIIGGGETAPPQKNGGELDAKVEAAVGAIDDLAASLGGEKALRLDEIAREIQTITKEGT